MFTIKQQAGNIAIIATGVLSLALIVVGYLWWGDYQQKTTLVAANASLQERLKSYQTQAAEQTQALNKEESHSFRLKHLLQKTKAEYQKAQQQLSALQTHNDELVEAHNALEAQLSGQQQSSEQQHQNLLQEQQAAFATEKQQWLSDQEIAATQVSQLEKDLKQAQEAALKIQQDWDNNKRQLETDKESLQSQYDALVSRSKELSSEKQTLVEQQQQLKTELTNLKKQLDIAKSTAKPTLPDKLPTPVLSPKPIEPNNKLPQQSLPEVLPVVEKQSSS